jgi:hypothetical protein
MQPSAMVARERPDALLAGNKFSTNGRYNNLPRQVIQALAAGQFEGNVASLGAQRSVNLLAEVVQAVRKLRQHSQRMIRSGRRTGYGKD